METQFSIKIIFTKLAIFYMYFKEKNGPPSIGESKSPVSSESRHRLLDLLMEMTTRSQWLIQGFQEEGCQPQR